MNSFLAYAISLFLVISPVIDCNAINSTTNSTPTLNQFNSSSLIENDSSFYQDNVCAGKTICNLNLSQPEQGFYRCMCDSKCSMYEDCCPDSIFNNTPKKINLKFSCSEKMRFYMVSSCPSSFTDMNTRMKCETVPIGHDHEDVRVMKPLMDKENNIVYRNAYCAMCNDINNYDFFNLTYGCHVRHRIFKTVRDPEYLSNILAVAKFSPLEKHFISNYNGINFTCSHEIIIPNHLKPHIRYCEPNMISSCPSSFGDSAVIEKCGSVTFAVYSGRVRGKGIVYKNEHCAECNEAKDFYYCQDTVLRAGTSSHLYHAAQATICNDPKLGHLC